MTDEVAESRSETEEQSTLDWIWGMLEGDFNENPTVGQIIANAAITAIPLVDQAADARDLVANLKALIWDKRYNEVAVWLGLFFTLIGLIPSLGSLLKGVLKLVYRGAKLDAVFKVFNALAKGNAWEWLQKLRAGELRKHADDAARMMKQIMDNIIDMLNEALSYVPRWADDLYGKISDLIAEMRVIRGKIDEMFGQITKDLEAKLDELLAKQEKNQVEGGSRQTLVKKQEADGPPKHADEDLDTSIKNKKVNPASFADVEQLISNSRKQLESTGKYEPKYTQAELEHMVEQGTLNERYVVTLQKKKAPDSTVGYKRDSGRTTTWTTTIDQMEKADSDPKLLCDLNGMRYDPDAEWEIIVIDQGKYYQQDGGLTFIPNYENTAKLGKQEFSKKFAPEQIERVMSPEYSKQYAETMKDYKASGKSPYSKSDVKEYADMAFANDPQGKADFLARHEFTMEIGTNEHFSGDGLTKSTGESGYLPKGQHGTLETITFEKNPATIAELEESGAILRIPAKPIKN